MSRHCRGMCCAVWLMGVLWLASGSPNVLAQVKKGGTPPPPPPPVAEPAPVPAQPAPNQPGGGGLNFPATPQGDAALNTALTNALRNAGFTGRIQDQLTVRMGRPINTNLANAGRLLFFDNILGLNKDNSCAGCHSPLAGFGDPQPIAIGVDNNGIVGAGRTGPRNMRRSPKAVNAAFFPKMMWNSRFVALSNNPFNNRAGFQFPAPEGRSLSTLPHLLAAQAFLPVTQQPEMAGFKVGTDHTQMRTEIARLVNLVPGYRLMFASLFPSVAANGPITYDMISIAIAEFEFTLTRANAPLDQFARGTTTAMTRDQKIGGLIFFGKGRCVQCHKVGGPSNEMFSDFQDHVVGVPQIVPKLSNATFDGPGQNEDFGREQITKNPNDRYKFRTAPLRNVALQPFFFHDGAFNTLEDVVRHYNNIPQSANNYSPVGRLPADLTGPIAPIAPILAKLDPILRQPLGLNATEQQQLVAFLRFALLDANASPAALATLIPAAVPSGMPVARFQ